MTREVPKGSPGFFSVLLGRGSATLRQDAPAQQASGASASSKSTTGRDTNARQAAANAPAPRLSGPAAFEAAVRSYARPSMDDRSRSRSNARDDARPQHLSSAMRVPQTERFVDASEDIETRIDAEAAGARHSRKVAFRTPTSSIRKGRGGERDVDTAAEGRRNSFSAPAPARREARPRKGHHSRSMSQVEIDERNWNSSTATLQNKEEVRPQSKTRRPTKGGYPLAADARRDSFHAVRASGPDRVIIVTGTQEALQDAAALAPRASAPAPVARRPGPTPLAVHPSKARRAPRELTKSTSKLVDVEQGRPSRSRTSSAKPVTGEADAVRAARRTQKWIDADAPRTSISSRPLPTTAGGDRRRHATSYNDAGTLPPRERHADARPRALRS